MSFPFVLLDRVVYIRAISKPAMRIAILSDIHSNLQALSRAIQLIEDLGADDIYCLGDIVGYGGNPNECLEIIRGRASMCVLGNHDVAVLNPSETKYLDKHGAEAAMWTQGMLTAENRSFLSGLELIVQTDLVTLAHASPGNPGSWRRIVSLEHAAPQFGYFGTPLCFIGHTHIPFVCGEDLKTFQVRRGVRFLVNVGSVGQPRDDNPRLSFGFFDTETWEYRNIRSDYDVEGSAETIRERGLPLSLAERLFRGV